MKTIYWLISMPPLILLIVYIACPQPTVHKDLQRSSAGLMAPGLTADPPKMYHQHQQVIFEVENKADPMNQGHRGELNTTLLTGRISSESSNSTTTTKTDPTNQGRKESSKDSNTIKTGPTHEGYRVSSPSPGASKYPTTGPTSQGHRGASKYPTTGPNQGHVGGGYVLSQDYWEQMTAGSRNLLTLQCWAARLNMSVVEPFIKRSDLYSPTSEDEVKVLPRFGAAYDLDQWNAQNRRAALTSWEQFVKRAPRNLIVVNIRYVGTVSTPDGVLHREGCTDSQHWNNLVRFLKGKGFTVRRKLCMNFQYKEEINESIFHEEIFADNDPRDSTVLFGQWRGLHNRRMYQTHSGCEKVVELQAVPSKQVYLDAKKYIERYLRTRDYLSIFVRMEKAMRIMEERKTGTVSTCFQETLDNWHTMVSKTGLNNTFLSSDIGKLGSKSLLPKKSSVVGPFSKFLKAIYGGTQTIKQWENTFRSTSRSPQAGYIAMMQKAIAAGAKCVLFVGGGSFQRNALKLYKETHAEKDWCIQLVKKCTTLKS